MHAYIVTGGQKETRHNRIQTMLTEWQVNPVDVVRIELAAQSIGISDIRNFAKRLTLTPYTSPYTVGIIPTMDLLTVEAQNALLKTLEEPPPHTRIIGETDRIHNILPTIISRCTIISLPNDAAISQEALEDTQQLLKKLLKQSPGARLQTIEAFEKTREDAAAWIALALEGARSMLLSSEAQEDGLIDRKTLTTLLHKLLLAQKQLATNVSPKLVVDNIFLP